MISTITQSHCLYKEFNKKKKIDQYCKFPICFNENKLAYCLNHLPLNEIGPNGKMIKCPQCRQPIGEGILQRHLRVCNMNKLTKEISNEDIETPRKWHQKTEKVSDISQDVIDSLKVKIAKLHESINYQVTAREIFPNELNGLFSQEVLKGKNAKNILQEASIIGNMLKEDILQPEGLFIELGCGAGEFSKTIQSFCKNQSNHLLVDRMKYTARHRYDHLIKDKIEKNYFNRLTIDIKDLKLIDYAQFDNLIGCSKHLCGSACDVSLELFANTAVEAKTVAIAIATCCHYLLKANTFINTSFFLNQGFIEEEFNAMARLTSWSTLKEESENFAFGKRIKKLIDYARLDYLKQRGFEGLIVEYTTQTKENHLLLAYKHRSN